MLGMPIRCALEMNNSPTESSEMDNVFAYPDAQLVRSMRRCDKKLLPMFDSWSAVDVVMTSKEIVYLDAVGADSECTGTHPNEIKQAVVSTRGGKGLPLRDVVAGRRVVGQLLLSDIESVHVERELPHGPRDGESDGPDVAVEKTEYWQSQVQDMDRASHWWSIKQDVLRIHTVDGFTLCLRFYSDLDNAEANHDRLAAENEERGPLFKNNAFQWAQTVTRFCGPGQLRQSLPHFGQGDSDELRDVLVVKTDGELRHHRIRSTGEAGLRFLSRGASNLVATFRRERIEI